jgi:hypothetical protein
VVILALLRWKRAENASKLPLESFFESLEAAIRYVRYTPGIQIVVARNVLFAFFISLIPALNIFRIEMMLPSWSGYLLQRERLTKAERELIDRAKTYHIGSHALEERVFLCVNKELHTPGSRLV